MRIDPHSAMKDTYVPSYCLPEFGKDGVVKGELKDGYFVPSGAMLPCECGHMKGCDANADECNMRCSVGAGIQAGTILKYGGYFPAGTAFPKGVIVPLHARMGESHFRGVSKQKTCVDTLF